jgi:predicted aminopeptidase
MSFSSVAPIIMTIAASLHLAGCYTVAQGYEQARLMSKRVPLAKVLQERTENPERLAKLALVPDILKFAESKLGMTPGSSYRHYISLDRPALSYVVQAADKRRLKLKTWWFPIVGAQPYLGYFDRAKAIDFQKELVAEGYDTSMGGVQAFSLLGYFPDPIYSSMVDGNDRFQFVELLFHETLHRTLYVPNAYTFNENLADFVARQATALYLRNLTAGEKEAQDYLNAESRLQGARKEFRDFLKIARSELESFYAQKEVQEAPMESFLEQRRAKFADLHARFLGQAGSVVQGTHYANFFHPERFNNATLLGASVYESRQEPFEQLLERIGPDLAKFIEVIRTCVADAKRSEAEIWDAVTNCKG